MREVGTALLSIGIGYVLGSLSPAYWLGRILRRIDMRTIGLRNAGTRNAKKELGLWPAVLTALIDTGKGVVALVIAVRIFGLPEYLAVLPVGASVAGHIFPFYLGFRGGRGSATAIGALIYLTAVEIVTGRFSPLTLLILLAVALIVYLATRSGDVTGLVTFFGMAVVTPLELGLGAISLLDTALALFLLVSIFLTSRHHGVFTLERSGEIKL